jgi:hypothetical protein
MMTTLTQKTMVEVLEALTERATLAGAMRVVGLSAGAGHNWNARSRADKAKGLGSKSDLWVKWRGMEGYFHDAARMARREQLEETEALIRAEAHAGTLMWSNGNPVWMQDAKLIAEWEGDAEAARNIGGITDPFYLHDKDGARIQARIPLAATTRNLVLASNFDNYNPTKHIDVTKGPGVTTIDPTRDALKALPRPTNDEVEGMTPKRRMLEEAHAHLADPKRVTKPTGPVQSGPIIQREQKINQPGYGRGFVPPNGYKVS